MNSKMKTYKYNVTGLCLNLILDFSIVITRILYIFLCIAYNLIFESVLSATQNIQIQIRLAYYEVGIY